MGQVSRSLGVGWLEFAPEPFLVLFERYHVYGQRDLHRMNFVSA